MAHEAPVNVLARQKDITKHWSPIHLLTLNAQTSFKLATFAGTFIWHTHPLTDEIFYVVSGGPLHIEIATNPESKHEKDGFETVELKVGDMFKVGRGWRHRPVVPAGEAGVLLAEAVGTVNTGDQEGKEGAGGKTSYVDES